jgi:hypothetical protein
VRLTTKIHHLRAARRARRRLSAEVAGFASAAERAELEQILDRHTPEQTREIRAILGRHDAALLSGRALATAHRR